MRALVISGGGSKGAFAVGVVKRLLNQYDGLDFDILVGTSTGSLIIPLIATGNISLLEKLYSTRHTSDIIIKHNIGDRLAETSIFDATPLWNLVMDYYPDEVYQQVINAGKKLFFTTTCLQTGELVVFTNFKNDFVAADYKTRIIENADHFRRCIMASACQPVFMPPIKVNLKIKKEKYPHHQYVDGGVREYAGIQMAIDAGATEIFTILLSVTGDEKEMPEFKSIFPILQRTIDIFTTDVAKNDLVIPQHYNEAIEYIDAVRQKMIRAGIPAADVENYFKVRGRQSPYEGKLPLKIFIIRPEQPLGGGPGGLTFEPEEMKRMIETGAGKADDFIASLKPNEITWA